VPHVNEFDPTAAQRSKDRPSVAAVDSKQIFHVLGLEHAGDQGTAIYFHRRSLA
jgi:hypothetical protein